jgi:hypothetical protein
MKLFVRAGAAISAALGAWISLGAVAVAPLPDVSTRVAVLPPFWVLGIAVLSFLVVVFGLRLGAARCSPLFAGLLPMLALSPGPIPASFLLWQGVPAAILWAGIAVAAATAGPIPWPARLSAFFTEPRLAVRIAATAAACVFALAWRGTSSWLPAGDEPHYLVITQSLLRDGDLRIDDNHARRDYLEYYFSELKPDFLKRGKDGHVYSIHAPGVSALVAPAFALGGYRGAAAFLLLLTAAGAGLLWWLAWRTSQDVGSAWFGWAVATTSAAVAPHAYTIYPDGASSALVLGAVWGLVSAARASAHALALAGLVAAVLPWLHTRNAVIAASVGAAMVLRLCARPDRRRAIASYLTVPLVSAGAWFASFWVIYGTPNPAAPYGTYTQSSLQNVPAGLSGLLVDQQYGLFATSPAFVSAAIGLGVALLSRVADEAGARRRRLALDLILVCAPYAVAVAAYRMWWGGASAPARFLVPLLVPLGIPAAWAWRIARRPADRAFLAALLLLGGSWTAVMTWGGEGVLAFTTRNPYGPVQEWVTRAVDLSGGMPAWFRSSPGQVVQLAMAWVACGFGVWLALRAVARSRESAAALTPPFIAAGVMAALSLGWMVSGVTPLRVDSSRLVALLRVERGAHALVIGRQPEPAAGDRRLFSASKALPLLQLQQVARGVAPTGQLASVAPLRAGVYRIVMSPAVPADAVVSVSIGRSDPVITRRTDSVERDGTGRRVFTVELPVEVNALVVGLNRPEPGAMAWIEPVRLVQGLDGFAGIRAATAHRYGDLIAYFATDRQFPEADGAWVRPDGESVVAVQSEAPRDRVTLYLRNGPTDNQVTLRRGSASEQFPLTPGQEHSFEVPLDGRRAAAFGLRVSRWFRPSDGDPGSDDVRRLGAWIELRP